MKVPKIALFRNVTLAGDDRVHRIIHIDPPKGTFRLRDMAKDYPMESYDPVPDWENFMAAVEGWDYHYRMAEGARYEEGKETETALRELVKRLPLADQHRLQKIVDVVVSVNEK